MKKRILSAIVMLLFAVPIVLAGGKVFSLAIGLLSVLALKEMIDLKKSHGKIPSGIILYAAITLLVYVFYIYKGHDLSYGVSQRLMIITLLGFLIPTLLRINKREYQTKDAFYLFGVVLFLGLAFNSIIVIRDYSLYLLGYLIVVSVATDVFAYLVGRKFGKRKIFPLISPNKTLAGVIGGTSMGTILGSIYHYYLINGVDGYKIVLISFFLSLAAQFGDLLFSKIKRENEIKDFSNLIPGHGGILDRLDSFLVIVVIYVLLLKFI